MISRPASSRGRLDKDEEKFFKKLVKALGCLGQNPRHNSVASHEIDDLTRKYGLKIFQSYLENNTPSAGRMFWAYGPDKGDITVLAIEPHPEDQKRGAYQRIKLAAVPELANRVLRVIVSKGETRRVVTVHPDRKMKGKT